MHSPPQGLIALTRPGFEPEAAAELRRWAEAQGIPAELTVQARSGYVLLDARAPLPDEISLPSWRELVFARECLPWFDRLTLPERDRVRPLLENVVHHHPRTRFSALRLAFPDSDEGRPLSGFCRRLRPHLETALTGAGKFAERARDALVFFFPSSREAFLGNAPAAILSPWENGIPRLRLPAEAPSRSALKLAEALLVLLDEDERAHWLRPGTKAVDLGAAPGGWTWQMVQRGLRVSAIDNGRLDARLLASGLVDWQRADGFTWRPRGRVDWLLCDMVEQPSRIAELVGRWFAQRLCRYALFNLKLPMKKRLEALEDARKRLQRLTREAGGIELRCKQLYHDREEVTVFARALA
ncbi:23S rRNA (cytidine(2498)-2'-O)-methyltransferase RlmM [Tepidiphilus margaritifer]|uniref:23S rRNA (cytidine(2498)-2'-O)-methyltransferase RlmM n=1 Tax=Tepidiphilus margaritifer TaxID=203471 RepID=UPI000417FB35|nr:23S rRNA (cytidine(2498)-2'-O)-methyltransferase RlmM [Tepidiphilus margaritifer]